MYNALISLGVAAATTLIFGLLLGGVSWSALLYGIVPGLIALVVAYFLLARRTYNQVQQYFQKAQQPLQNRDVESAIKIIKEAYSLAEWQFLVEAQIDAQIGTILYSAQKFDRAEDYLQDAFDNSTVVNAILSQNWRAPAMLGVIHYRNKNFDEMREVFEDAVATNEDKPLLWNLYAYCLWKSRNRSDAIDVLNRAVDEVDDQKTQDNLNALKNNSKMNMSGWGNQWYQFHLDRPSPQQRRGQQMQFRRQR
jgi:tetratricopeptide (TPR) repeat protein